MILMLGNVKIYSTKTVDLSCFFPVKCFINANVYLLPQIKVQKTIKQF